MPVSVAQAIAQARGRGVDLLDAQLLLARLLSQRRSWLLAHGEALLHAAQAGAFDALSRRRAAGEPLAYLLGEKEFHGLVLQVDARVLVPRPDTELLVDWALEWLATRLAQACGSAPTVVDLGTGSGAIALAIKHRQPQACVTATDLSPDALQLARHNATRLALSVQFAQGAWWDALPGRRFDLVLSNPPYIAAADPHLAALMHEPALALAAGDDGLRDLRLIVAGASPHIESGGWLLLEHGFEQGEAVRALLRRHGFAAVQTRRDLAGLERCTGGQRCAALGIAGQQ